MGLLRVVKENRNLRKIFGERELKIIEKQLLGINLTQSERNRLSRDIRKKLEAVQELARFSDEFKLKKGMEVKRLIEEAKEEIVNDILHRKIKTIKLFGSSVKGERTFRSDVDIAVEFDNIDLKDAASFRKRILGRLPEKFDVLVYNVLEDKIKKRIDEEGKILWRKNQK